MSLPPERISIKRRRQEDPVDLLYLDQNRRDDKRRFTDYCFELIRSNVETPPVPPLTTSVVDKSLSRNSDTNGIPVVRATAPGDEIRDEIARQAAQKALRESYQVSRANVESVKPSEHLAEGALSTTISHSKVKTKALRQFRLNHDTAKILGPTRPSGIRKRTALRSRPIATFIEKTTSSRHRLKLLKALSEKDRNAAKLGGQISQNEVSITKQHLDDPSPESGRSMHDHPSTWDYGSEELSQELADFSLELSKNERPEISSLDHAQKKQVQDNGNVDVLMEDDFVYDTYFRVPVTTQESPSEGKDNVGILVIENEDEELWEQFAENDSDSDWDEEDPDSNAEDNPANDYPDDDLDEDDEYGYGAYRHRKYGSDDEEYDVHDTWSDSE